MARYTQRMGTGLVWGGLMACAFALAGCGAAEREGFAVDGGDADDAGVRPDAPTVRDPQVPLTEAGVASDGGADANVEPCPIGVTRCHDYRQERCVDPNAGWTDLKTSECCVDETRFTYSSTTAAVTDAKTTLQWKRVEGTNGCASPWRYARLAEIKTLMLGKGACSPDADRRFFSDPTFCDTYGTDCINMTNGTIVPNGTGERICVR